MTLLVGAGTCELRGEVSQSLRSVKRAHSSSKAFLVNLVLHRALAVDEERGVGREVVHGVMQSAVVAGPPSQSELSQCASQAKAAHPGAPRCRHDRTS